ncbi:uncharacterized protein EAF01_006148 [Botrytis porri]|uniref:Uncharacterized protein n=1 Tax=Botrytis porri TaxID=87229 RepID=A0A4Z1L0U7_9HELO|nr:uncharacterized protein EAF01_006148 [Botrytis porri]KAF7905627.1 hypothetical protein EAF01_006148 [Botrytis porri]TGO90351.1 hypothetical protein BPOR_0068g00180 [Botrytis porri]
MEQISATQTPIQGFQALDSYIDVDFAQLFYTSISISNDRLKLKGIADKSGPGFHNVNGKRTGICAIAEHKAVDDDDEVDPLTVNTKPFMLTPEPSSPSSRSSSSSESSSTSTSTNSNLKVENTAQTAVVSKTVHQMQASDSTTAPEISSLQHPSYKGKICNQGKTATSLTTTSATPIIVSPTSRIELRALYEKYPDICPKLPAPPPAFFNRDLNQQTYLKCVRSPPITPRKYGQPDSRRLAESFASRTPLPSKIHLHPRTVKESLREWYGMAGFMAKCRRDEQFNPYPHLDLNAGWNRARVQGEQWHDNFHPWQKPNKKILEVVQLQEQLLKFSWGEQVDSIVVDGGLAEGVFERVFEGVDAEKERMAGCGQKRIPGAWWAQRKRIFYDLKGRGFREEVHIKNCQIWDGVKVWAANEIDAEYGKLKRKIDVVEKMAAKADDMEQTQIEEAILKRHKARHRIIQIMSATWRAKRRSQEKKAGRWTDGTPLQNRMWAEFHWVLDAPDHRDRRFFDTRDWPRMFAERGWPGVSATRVWAEFYHGWGPLQSWLYWYTLQAQRQRVMFREREGRQRRQRQWAIEGGGEVRLPDARSRYVGNTG